MNGPMGRSWAFSWLPMGMFALALTQVGTGCGRLGNEGQSGSGGVGAGGTMGSGGHLDLLWGTGGWIVEGCGSPSVDPISFCFSDCPDYDPNRAACDPACGYPAPGCGPSSGGASSSTELSVLTFCLTSEHSAAMGGMGGEGACAPVCGVCASDADCCTVTGTPVCLQGVCVYR